MITDYDEVYMNEITVRKVKETLIEASHQTLA